MEDDKEGDESSHSFAPLAGAGRTSEKAEAQALSLEAQFLPVNDPSEPAAIEMFNEAMRAYEYDPQVNRN
jgi:hypothetical protein